MKICGRIYIYGKDVILKGNGHPFLIEIQGDIRDKNLLEKYLPGYDTVIHLACISNDPSYELDPDLGFEAKHTIKDAVLDLKKAFDEGNIPDPMDDIRYYNIKTMQTIKLN